MQESRRDGGDDTAGNRRVARLSDPRLARDEGGKRHRLVRREIVTPANLILRVREYPRCQHRGRRHFLGLRKVAVDMPVIMKRHRRELAEIETLDRLDPTQVELPGQRRPILLHGRVAVLQRGVGLDIRSAEIGVERFGGVGVVRRQLRGQIVIVVDKDLVVSARDRLPILVF